ncbi:FliI/YscN family ATPase [Ahrensia marina]|uniref:ATP synthase n=1 Tax=Ahrensia marina TaxID=1514904 RepID=A0A0M9GLP2_9HYPH|nr:FliI/YscN family ATPase [Ahrensia marina]KPB00710.1 ATP synthase [Ahrensia marina]
MASLTELADTVAAGNFLSEPVAFGGRVKSLHSNSALLEGMPSHLQLGDMVKLLHSGGSTRVEVVKISDESALGVPCEPMGGISPGAAALIDHGVKKRNAKEMLGRVVNALGEPIDEGGRISLAPAREEVVNDFSPMKRGRVDQPIKTGIRLVDIFTPICVGQRLGIFAGSGVGKSTLLAMFAKTDDFQAVVISLVGERSREVREFVEDTLGPERLQKSIIVVATSDESAVMRKRAPLTAMEIARDLAREGKRVLCLVDSLTRYAHALREVAVTLGEPPVSRGYPSSVFTELPRLLEMAGPSETGSDGSVTLIATVLVDGDDHNDPVSDCLRGILDGHLVLDRGLANRGRLPAIDPAASISRLATKVWSNSERGLVSKLKAMVTLYEESRDLRMMGGYQPGADADLDHAVSLVPVIYEFLKQGIDDPVSSDVFADMAAHLKQETGSE